MRRGYVDSTCGQIHYRTAGSGEQVMVLLHQTAASSRMYESFMAGLEGEFRLLALDTPGFGGSDPWPTPPGTADLVEALAAAVEGLDVTSYHLFGHHTGAGLATEWAARHADRTRSLAMVGGLVMGPEARASWLAGVTDAPVRADGGHLAAAWDRVAGIDQSPVVHVPDPELRHREAVDVLVATPRWPEAYRAIFAQDYESHLAAVRCPTLLISGDEDVLWPYFEPTVAFKPGISAHVLRGGAYLLDQQTDEVVRIVREFHSGLE